jgi:unspecific monooxygenase
MRLSKEEMPPRTVLPPGPRMPAAWQLLRCSFSPLEYLEQCAARYGETFTLQQAGYGTHIILSSPQAVRDVFKADPQVLHSGEGAGFLQAAVGPTSVLVVDGQPHTRQRRLLLPPFKGERMRAFFDAMQAAVQEELRTWSTETPMRMLEPMRRITLRVISQAVMGLSPGAQLDNFERRVERMLAFTRTRHTFVWVKLVPFRLLSGAASLPYFREARALDAAIFDHIACMRGLPPDERGTSVLADLLNATDEMGAALSDPEIRDALITMLIAGHDTTAIALAWTLAQIASHPDVTEELQAELQCATGGAPPRADQVDALPYLDATIRESLRLRTIFSFVVRLAKQPFVAGDREYPAGVKLCPCNHLVHRREDLYPDPLTFRPKRFIERRFAGHEWFPFGGGNRTCLGAGFALYQMKVTLATMLARVRLSRPRSASSAVVRQGISLAPRDGAAISVQARAGGS